MNTSELMALISNPENIKKSRSGFFMEIKWEWQKKIWWLKKLSIYNIKAKLRYLFAAFFYTLVISFSFYYFLSFNLPALGKVKTEHLTIFDALHIILDFKNNYDQSWFGNFITASAALFVGIFVYRYTLFNNKWRYAADLYNKLYIDQFNAKDQLDFFRKRCLLAQDILKMNLLNHPTFCYETSQTIIMAAIIYEKLTKDRQKKTYDILSENNSVQIIFLHEKPNVILRSVLIEIEEAMYASNLKESHPMAADFQKTLEEFKKQYLLIQSLKDEIKEMKKIQNDPDRFAL